MEVLLEHQKNCEKSGKYVEAETNCSLKTINMNLIIQEKVNAVFEEANLPSPFGDGFGEKLFNQVGGKIGMHTEHLGFILAEMQHLQRTYPGATW